MFNFGTHELSFIAIALFYISIGAILFVGLNKLSYWPKLIAMMVIRLSLVGFFAVLWIALGM